MTVWIKTADRRPSIIPGQQVDVLYANYGWPVAHLGMYTCFRGGPSDNPDDYELEWAMYDAADDRYYVVPEPELWCLAPEVPECP